MLALLALALLALALLAFALLALVLLAFALLASGLRMPFGFSHKIKRNTLGSRWVHFFSFLAREPAAEARGTSRGDSGNPAWESSSGNPSPQIKIQATKSLLS